MGVGCGECNADHVVGRAHVPRRPRRKPRRRLPMQTPTQPLPNGQPPAGGYYPGPQMPPPPPQGRSVSIGLGTVVAFLACLVFAAAGFLGGRVSLSGSLDQKRSDLAAAQAQITALNSRLDTTQSNL